MEIIFHNHDAPVSDRMRRRAEGLLAKVARRSQRPVDGVVRFQQDGTVRRVELVLHTGSGRRFVASAEGRYFGNALADAARRLTMQLNHTKRTPKAHARRLARTRGARTP